MAKATSPTITASWINANSAYITGPMLDGTIMPITPITAWTTGRFNHMPIMGGNVQDEQNFSIGIGEYFAQPQAPITADQYTTAAGAPAVLSENVPALSTFTLAQWSANHHCDFWTGNTLNGGILRFQP